MENVNKRHLIESLLFIAAEPLGVAEIKKLIDLPEDEVRALLQELAEEYRARNGGCLVVEVANGYQMVSNPLFALWIRKLHKSSQSSKLSTAALETLAIIAYKQPITKMEVEELRGVNTDAVMKNLAEKHLIKILGKKEVPGKPFLYGTTKEFLQYFGLKDLSELPTLKELKRDDSL